MTKLSAVGYTVCKTRTCITVKDIMKQKQPNDVYTLADLQKWSNATRGIKPPIRLAVIGDPVAHSQSPLMQNAALQDRQIDAQYTKLHIKPDELEEALALIRENDFVGANVTLPHKQRALELMDESDQEATDVGAVNTIVVRSQKLIGFNTDGVGFSRAVREEFSVDLKDLRVLIIGAGGVARAIAFECGKQGCERLVIANRTKERAAKLTKQLQKFFVGPKVLGPVSRLQEIGLSESELRSQIPHTDLLVNATSLGLERSDPIPIGAHMLEPHLMVYDTIYLPRRSPLLLAAEQAGARAANGVSMLLQQGARAFEIWFGREAPVAVMRSALQSAIAY